MTISLRLDDGLERKLNRHARLMRRTKSELIRGLISDFVEERADELTPWELGKEVFGREGSNRGNLSVDRKSILKEKLRAKNSSR